MAKYPEPISLQWKTDIHEDDQLIDDMHYAGDLLKAVCYGIARESGWWTDPATLQPRDKPTPEALLLMISEIVEGFEGWRRGDRMDDKLPHRKMLEVELADAVIRIFDFAGGRHLDIAGAIVEKLQYNCNRVDHTLDHRANDAEGKKC